jgi:hypothetical protein
MTQFVFGSGVLICKRTDVASTPSLLGTLQEVSVDFDRKIETLLGQYNFAVAAGGAEFKITGKSKSARFQAATINNIFLGQTLTSGSVAMATTEQQTVVSGGFTITNSGTFAEDLGLFYQSGGVALGSVTSNPAAGQYSYTSSGIYDVNSADNGKVIDAFYNYTLSGGSTIGLANQLQGPLPIFELSMQETFNYYGTTKTLLLKLNACVSSKLSMTFNNSKFAIPEFDFQAIADISNNIGSLYITE